MAAIKQLAAVTRSGIGKGAARSVRRAGRVPGVVYGGGEKAEPISVDFKELSKLLYSGHFLTSIYELDIEGRKQRVLPRDYQLDVVSDTPLHVDFFRLKAGSRVRIAVPVRVTNRDASPGLKKGGAVNLVLHSLELLTPADSIPESITIDLTGLDFHDSVHVSDLSLAGRLPGGGHPHRLHRGDRRAADHLHGRGPRRRRGRRSRRPPPTRPAPPPWARLARLRPPLRAPPALRRPPLRPRRPGRRRKARQEVTRGRRAASVTRQARPPPGGRAFFSREGSCFSSPGSATLAANTPGTATTSASWR